MKALLPLTLLAALAAGNSWAACPYPKAPEKVPDGSTATIQQMLETQKAVKQFDLDVGAYQTCLDGETSAAIAAQGEKLSEERKNEMLRIKVQKQNAAAEEATALAARFNDQVKVYKEKNKKP
jgi:uncharacterized protein involved in tellurium resistance